MEKWMQVKEIARRTGTTPTSVRTLARRHKVRGERWQGHRGTWLDMPAYIAALREAGFMFEADVLEGKRRLEERYPDA